MPLIEYPAASATVHVASWLWTNRESLGTAWSRLSDAVSSSLAAPRAEIHRLGSAIVSVGDGQTRVLGLLHEQSTRLDAIDAAVSGLATGQTALGHSLDVLQNLSMLTLGISAASSLVLFRQFHALRAQLSRVERATHRIGTLIEAQQLGQLETGLNQLHEGMEDIQSGRIEQGRAGISHTAANNLVLNVNQHAILLDRELKVSRVDRTVVRSLFRHLTVGLMGVAGCHLSLGHPIRAREAISTRMGLIERYAKEVFRQTVGDNPVRFLCPTMAGRGVTMEFLAELYRQAALAGAVGGSRGCSAADLIETWRVRLHESRNPFRTSTLEAWHADLAEALAAMEEVNRVKGLALALGGLDAGQISFAEAMTMLRCEIGNRVPPEGIGFAFFPA
jgi:hypothetical protein